MPWKLEETAEGFFVVNSETGKKMSGKPLPRKRAVAQLRALYKNVPEARKDYEGDGIMIALYPPRDVAEALSIPGGQPAEDIHLTLAYLGTLPAKFNPYQMFALLEEFCANHAPIQARTSSTTVFQNPGETATVVLVDSPLLPEFRQALVGLLRTNGIMPDTTHGFIPHMTLSYEPQAYTAPAEIDFLFDEVRFCVGDQQAIFPLNDQNMIVKEVAAAPTAVMAHGGKGGLMSAPGMGGTILSASGRGDHLPMNAADAPGMEVRDKKKRRAAKKIEEESSREIMAVANKEMAGRRNGLVVFKDHSGAYRWITFSSNAYRDRDEEIVSTKALTNDVMRADQDGNYGPLRWWHVPGVDIGTCDFNMMAGRVLIESGTFNNDFVAKTVKENAHNLEVSLGFTHPPDEPDASGVFHRIRRFERSLCPRGRVSNRFTRLIVQ